MKSVKVLNILMNVKKHAKFTENERLEQNYQLSRNLRDSQAFRRIITHSRIFFSKCHAISHFTPQILQLITHFYFI